MATEENTGCFGPVYWSSLTPSEQQPLISQAWTNEIEAPWRRGRGIAVRVGTRLWTVGLWRRSSAPREEPTDLNLESEVIRSW